MTNLKDKNLSSIFSILYFDMQPIFKIEKENRKVVCYELLLRSTEKNTFPIEIFHQIIKCKKQHTQLLQWYKNKILSLLELNSEISISINIHPQQLFYTETFLMFKNLQHYSNRILIEITEDDTKPSIACKLDIFLTDKIIEIKKMQFSVALDDVSTGIYSFKNIRPLLDKIDMIKLSYISLEKLPQKDISCLINFWSEIANKLGIDFVVEGVENINIHKYLLDNVICLQQGFYLSKPFSASKLIT
nr:EAL domain-containing protein [Enterococcus sp. DIV2402]MBO0463675.1 EAL domain-containing protein [Enterococcus sp. DIV2402]